MSAGLRQKVEAELRVPPTLSAVWMDTPGRIASHCSPVSYQAGSFSEGCKTAMPLVKHRRAELTASHRYNEDGPRNNKRLNLIEDQTGYSQSKHLPSVTIAMKDCCHVMRQRFVLVAAR